MKTEEIGLPGSVAIIGLIYAVALAAAPETGLSAPTDATQTDQTVPFEYQTAGVEAAPPDVTGGIEPSNPVRRPLPAKAMRDCTSAFGEEMSFAEFMQVHHRLPNRPTVTPGLSSPAWGKAKITVF